MIVNIDFHIHSNASFDGIMSFDDIVKTAKTKNINAIAICDHNVVNLKTKYDDTIIIPGVEISTRYGHILGLFITNEITGKTDIEKIKSISNNGGLVFLAHPFEHTLSSTKFDDIVNELDGIEVINSRACKNNYNANKQALDYAKNNNLIMIAGSDAHTKNEIGGSYISLECEEYSLESIKKALLSRKFISISGKECNYINISKSQFNKMRKKGFSPKRFIKWLLMSIKCILIDIARKKQSFYIKM